MKTQTQTILSRSPAETRELAARIAARLRPGAVLALTGPLGAGKTCFVQGLAAALDVDEPVTSPTYTLANEYRGRLPVYHIDLYRIGSAEEAFGLGIDEYLEGNGVTLIEWADRAEEVLPPDALRITFRPGASDEEREITIAEGSP